jgi:hypothetical protein
MSEPTPEARAEHLDDSWEITENMPFPAEFLFDLADEIRSAVAAERERCAERPDKVKCPYCWAGPHNCCKGYRAFGNIPQWHTERWRTAIRKDPS